MLSIDGVPRISSVDPIPIANYKDPEYGMVVRTLDDLLGDPRLETVWRNFYLTRLRETVIITGDTGRPNLVP